MDPVTTVGAKIIVPITMTATRGVSPARKKPLTKVQREDLDRRWKEWLGTIAEPDSSEETSNPSSSES
jgi:hypothetical protein